MANAATYSLTTTGDIHEGFELQDVVAGFATLFDIPPEKAAAYVDRQRLIRKGLTPDAVEEYVEELNRIGMVVGIHEGVVSRPRNPASPPASFDDWQSEDDTPVNADGTVALSLHSDASLTSGRLTTIIIGLTTVLAVAFVIALVRTDALPI